MKTRNLTRGRSQAVIRGRNHPTRAGSPGIRIIDTAGNIDGIYPTIYVDGALVTEADDDDDAVFITIGGSTGTLAPESQIVATKDAGNPTANFNGIPESIVKVGSTYYMCYLHVSTSPDQIRLATAASPNGPWTAGGSTILTLGTQAWEGVSTEWVPHLMEKDGTFYLWYSVSSAGAATYAVGYATATTVTGPYTKYAGNPVFLPGTAGQWDDYTVGEAAVFFQGGQWIMWYMGNRASPSGDLTEQCGVATAPDPAGPWTRAPGNPLLPKSSISGAFDENGTADPAGFYSNGYYWVWYAGISGGVAGDTLPWQAGLAYSTSATGPYTKHNDNPILTVGASGSWDDSAVWRGSIYEEAGVFYGIYGGMSDDPVNLLSAKGGNFTFNVTGIAAEVTAADVPITDAGGYYSSSDVEGALQEIGADLADVLSGSVGHYETLYSGSAPPVAITNPAEDDALVGFVPD